MSISFEESLKKAQIENDQSSIAVHSITSMEDSEYFAASLSLEDTQNAAYSGDEWILDDRYKYYEEYSDDITSSIDSRKNILLDSNQTNVTQETNSQYIPFKMARYYDGFDLTNTTLTIYFVNRNNRGYESDPVNVYYNSTTIHFAWLVDRRATSVDGKVSFEIRATGVNSKGDEYVWKTKPCDGLNVIKSLSGNITIPDDGDDDITDTSWITESINNLEQRVEELEYKPITIESFTNTIGTSTKTINTIELGRTVKNVTLNWELSRTPTTLLLDSVPIDPSQDKLPLSGQDIKGPSTKSWKLVAIDERGIASATETTSIRFLNEVRYGEANLPDVIDSDFIESLPKSVLDSTPARTINFNATGSQYLWYCYPVRLGQCQFKIGGNIGGFGLADTVMFKNSEEYEELYYVFRNGHEGIGQITVYVEAVS